MFLTDQMRKSLFIGINAKASVGGHFGSLELQLV